MTPFPKYLKLSAIAASGLILCVQGAQVPQHIDIKQLSKTVEDVVVPLPNEIFGALNKLGAVNWRNTSAAIRERILPNGRASPFCLGQ